MNPRLSPDMTGIGLKPHICGKARAEQLLSAFVAPCEGFMAAAKFDGPMEYPVEGYAPIGPAVYTRL